MSKKVDFKKLSSYYKIRRIYRLGLGIFAALFAIIAVVTYYGQSAGNFVISVDDIAYGRGIVISKDPEFRTQGSRVSANALDNVSDVSFIDFSNRLPEIIKSSGDYKDPQGFPYLAFTFYVKNVGDEAVDVQMDIETIENYINDYGVSVLDASRIVLIEDEKTTYVYQNKDEPYFDYKENYPDYYPDDNILLSPIYFDNLDHICTNIIRDFRPGQVKKYSFLLWLEGTDPDCTIKLAGGKVKLQMYFSILSEDEE